MTPTARTTIKRIAANAAYDLEVIRDIIDEALVCHVGFVDNGQPFVIPTIHFRMEDRLYLHGSVSSRMLRCLAAGVPACVSVTLVDGLVLARSLFNHSMNYRSVVILATAEEVTDRNQKVAALKALTDHVVPGRWDDARLPNEKELSATRVVSFPINEASAKVRTGPPNDDEPDYQLPVWAGIIPLAVQAGEPVPDPKLLAGLSTPSYALSYHRGRT